MRIDCRGRRRSEAKRTAGSGNLFAYRLLLRINPVRLRRLFLVGSPGPRRNGYPESSRSATGSEAAGGGAEGRVRPARSAVAAALLPVARRRAGEARHTSPRRESPPRAVDSVPPGAVKGRVVFDAGPDTASNLHPQALDGSSVFGTRYRWAAGSSTYSFPRQTIMACMIAPPHLQSSSGSSSRSANSSSRMDSSRRAVLQSPV